MIELEQYFKGEKAWEEFSANFNNEWIFSDFQKVLLSKLNKQIDLAQVIYYHIGESSSEWLNKKIPTSDNFIPLACLKTEKTKERLKECLMRMK